ncbi:helix-turn-helix transcriptional regulator [Conexibacter stalactiti]|uniref:Helix-turn-helix transcriptional regulator n=1 Tax=Conexibacter stalactiti TaxID=1940611 RepID=A0ABU4I1L4_9ACTN|nr:helix-turn-helix transcriptional regulator [Conexibacter stalactiti]MDW5598189.1 helix-turn-helix transcriptional regulator [Conexibacter stalactiti]MEC5038831.1 helix-turn-helix transcriptional regulator [Conexibacter stalactiti]
MTGEADLAAIGTLLADRTRATILLTLLNGGLTSASALAERAGVSRPLASAHLRKLTDGGLLAVEPHGRQRLYRLSSQAVADALEVLILLAPPLVVRSLRQANEGIALRHGRLCYDHLAGRAGVALTEALVEGGWLRRAAEDFDVTPAGAAKFAELEIDVTSLAERPRPLTRACLDWSERSHHLAGALGAALANELLRRGWLQAREASRVVLLTDAGRVALADHFGLSAEALELGPVGEHVHDHPRHDGKRQAA